MLGDKLRKLRKKHNKTQAELGKLLGTDQSGYSKYESGTRSLPVSLLGVLANYYRISIDDLLEFTPGNPKTDIDKALETLDYYGVEYSLTDGGITLKQNEKTIYYILFSEVPALVRSVESECNDALKDVKRGLFKAVLFERV